MGEGREGVEGNEGRGRGEGREGGKGKEGRGKGQGKEGKRGGRQGREEGKEEGKEVEISLIQLRVHPERPPCSKCLPASTMTAVAEVIACVRATRS